MSDLVIDVGANRGEFALALAERNPSLRVLAIEPIPELCEALAAAAGARGVTGLDVACCAIDATEREAEFHVSDVADQGVSSLLAFDADGLRADEYWRQRDDMRFARTITTSVRRLDSLPEVAAAERIRFVKIDAQGVDLAVLESLGEHLARTEAGVFEVAATARTRLYAGESQDLESALARLRELGFAPYAIKPNDPAANEFNVFFCRPGLDPAEFERELGLRGVPLYDGKHYWHLPSARLHPEAMLDPDVLLGRLAQVETALQAATERLQVVEAALERECAETRRLGAAVAQRDTRIQTMQLALRQAH